MPMNFVNLDATTRQEMLNELQADIANNTLYRSTRLQPTAPVYAQYERLLNDAFTSHNEEWLANEILKHGLLNKTQPPAKPGQKPRKMNHDAHITMAEGEFNRFYMRGVCLRAGTGKVEIYRSKGVSDPREISQQIIGRVLPAAAVLKELQQSPDIGKALGLGKPNSGLSIKLP